MSEEVKLEVIERCEEAIKNCLEEQRVKFNKYKSCWGCPDREVGCHSKCNGYFFRALNFEKRRAVLLARWTHGYTPVERSKITKRMKKG